MRQLWQGLAAALAAVLLLVALAVPAHAVTYTYWTTWEGNYRCAHRLTTHYSWWERAALLWTVGNSETRVVRILNCPRPPVGNERFGWWQPRF